MTLLQMILQLRMQTISQFRMCTIQLQETTFIRQEVLQIITQFLLIVQLEGILALSRQTRIII